MRHIFSSPRRVGLFDKRLDQPHAMAVYRAYIAIGGGGTGGRDTQRHDPTQLGRLNRRPHGRPKGLTIGHMMVSGYHDHHRIAITGPHVQRRRRHGRRRLTPSRF